MRASGNEGVFRRRAEEAALGGLVKVSRRRAFMGNAGILAQHSAVLRHEAHWERASLQLKIVVNYHLLGSDRHGMVFPVKANTSSSLAGQLPVPRGA